MPDRPVIVDVEELAALAIASAGAPDLHPEEVLALACRAERVAVLERLVVKLSRVQDPRTAMLLSPAETSEFDQVTTAAAARFQAEADRLLQLAGAVR